MQISGAFLDFGRPKPARRTHPAMRTRRSMIDPVEPRLLLSAQPVLDNTPDLELQPVSEDPGAPFGRVGTPVALLIDTDGTLQNFSDSDGDPPGIAVVATNLQGGTLWASTDNGDSWFVSTSVSEADPLLLTAGVSRLYFQPDADFNGTISNLLTIRAWDGIAWQTQGTPIDGLSFADEAANAVAMSADGDTVVVASPLADSNGEHSGHVRIFNRVGTQWTQRGLTIEGAAGEDHFGTSVAISDDGNTIAIGAEGNDDSGENAGQVQIYRWDSTNNEWGQLAQDINGEAGGDFSGISVSLSADGNTVAIGADSNDGPGTDGGTAFGQVRIYSLNNGSWQQLGADIDGLTAGSMAGYSVALSAAGTRVAIGAPYSDLIHENAGKVCVFDWNGTAWVPVGLEIYGRSPTDYSGTSIALSADGNILAIGSPGHDAGGTDTGHVRVFQLIDGTWTPFGLTVFGSPGEYFGTDVALSDDGLTLVVGAERNDINGYHSGQTRVYTFSNGDWHLYGQPLNGDEIEDHYGHAVDISADGRTLISGAYGSNNAVEDAGRATISTWRPSVSTLTDTVAVDVLARNDAPVLTAQDKLKLKSVTMDPGPPSGNVGTLISEFISADAPLQNYFDAESDAAGVAITAVDLKGGFLWYSRDDGANWQQAPEVSEFDPLLLSGSTTRLYYQPNGNNYGHHKELLTVRAWDGNYTWQQMGRDINGEAQDDQSGHAVALSPDGNTLVIGVPPNTDNTHEQGQLRLYRWQGTEWSFESILLSGTTTEELGWALALSDNGNTVVVGVPFDEGDPTDSGRVHIRRFDGHKWTRLGSDIDGNPGDELGWQVAISSSGNTVALSSISNSENGPASGRVQVWNWTGTAWQQLGGNIDGTAASDRTGMSIALSPDGLTLAVGSDGVDGAAGPDTGSVDIYTWNGTAWVQQGSSLEGLAAGDRAGTAVALSDDGTTVAIGAVGSNENGPDAGQVRIFVWNGSQWIQKGDSLNGEFAGDQSGQSLALSADGNTIIVGAPYNDGTGDNAGHARIWNWSNNEWVLADDELNGEAIDDLSGAAVALSADGTIAAVGAKFNEGELGDAGHVRVYRLAPSLSTDTQCVKIDVKLKITYPTQFTPVQRPVITWMPVPEAVRYDIWIGNSSTGTNPWHRGETHETTYEVPTDLGVGKMDLWVRGITNDGTPLDWSEMQRFHVTTATTVSDMTRRQVSSRPTITWPEVSGAASYDVWVNNHTTGEAQYRRDEVTTNSWTPTADMELAQYHLWVRARAADGFYADWGVRQHFYVTPIPSVTAPVHSTFDRSPAFQWGEVEGATSYALQLRSQLDGSIAANITGLPTPEWTPAEPLADGPYVWWGVAESSLAGIRSNWTHRTEFYVGGRTQVTGPVSPTTSNTPLIEWQQVDGAARYELWISTGGTTLIADQRQLTSTNWQVPAALKKQTRYDVWVRAISGDGQQGNWSRKYSFTIAAGGFAPSQDAPFGSTAVPDSALEPEQLIERLHNQRKQAVEFQQPITTVVPIASHRQQPNRRSGTLIVQPAAHNSASQAATAQATRSQLERRSWQQHDAAFSTDWYRLIAEHLDQSGPLQDSYPATWPSSG